MKNLAGSQDTDTARSELVIAGIPTIDVPRYGEPQVTVEGSLRGWSFRRAWYYWMANGPSVPVNVAEQFNQTWGGIVRVRGMSGGDMVDSPVSNYHIDSQDGLDAFAALLRTTFPSSHDDADVIFVGSKGKPVRLADANDHVLVHELGQVLYHVNTLKHPKALPIIEELGKRHADIIALRAEVERQRIRADKAERELHGLQRSLDEALNSGNGSYRP